jgi:hypothetical protein
MSGTCRGWVELILSILQHFLRRIHFEHCEVLGEVVFPVLGLSIYRNGSR